MRSIKLQFLNFRALCVLCAPVSLGGFCVLLPACQPAVLESGGDESTQDSLQDSAPDSEPLDSVPNAVTTECTLVTVAGSPLGSAENAEIAAVFATEGDAISWTVGCGEDSDAVLTPLNLPAGAVWSGSTLTWTPGLAAGGQYEVQFLALRDTATVQVSGTVWVADAWNDPANVQVDPTVYTYEMGVPVMHLEVPPATNYDSDVASSVVWLGHRYAIGVQYRGASSAYYPKHSFVLSFDKDDKFDAPGWKKRRNLNITSTFDDNTYIRQKLCYDLWSSMSDTHPQFQTAMAALFINGVYEGLQLITDHIDGEWWEDNGGREDANLYKAVDHSANFALSYNGRRKSSLHSGYEKKAGDDDWSDLDALVGFVALSDAATFEADLDLWVSRDDFMNWWAFVRFVDGGDSAGKNSYLYHDPLDAVGIWRYTPWDFNHSLGQDWQTIDVPASNSDDFTGNNLFFTRAFASPVLAGEMNAHLRSALDGPWAKAELIATFDANIQSLEAASRRDWAKWQPQFDGYWGWTGDVRDYDGEVAYMRRYLADRWDYMDSQTP